MPSMSPAIPEQWEKIQDLIKVGKQRGSITYMEVDSTLPISTQLNYTSYFYFPPESTLFCSFMIGVLPDVSFISMVQVDGSRDAYIEIAAKILDVAPSAFIPSITPQQAYSLSSGILEELRKNL